MRARGVIPLALLALGGCGSDADPGAPAAFTLRSASIDLPADGGTLPERPGRALVEANCLACHSAEMLTNQPPLKPAQWAATVKKMREVYRAPVASADDAAIVAYLSGLGAQSSNPASTVR